MKTLTESVTIDDITAYIGIDIVDDMILRNINRTILTADAFLKGAIHANYPVDDPRIKEIALIIIADLYENRSYTNSSNMTNNVRKLVEDMSLQLRLELSGTSSSGGSSGVSVEFKYPYIADSGNWFIWNAETSSYVDSGVTAYGHTPVKGVDYLTDEDKTEIGEFLDIPNMRKELTNELNSKISQDSLNSQLEPILSEINNKVDKIPGWGFIGDVHVDNESHEQPTVLMAIHRDDGEPGEVYADLFYPANSVDNVVNAAKSEALDKAETIKDEVNNDLDKKLDKKLDKEFYFYGSRFITETDKKYFIIDDTTMMLTGLNISEYEELPDPLVIPCGVESIHQDVFKNRLDLFNLVIPKHLNYIGTNAFSGCDNLVSIYFGGSKAEWEEIQINPGNEILLELYDIFYSDKSVSEDFVINLFSTVPDPNNYYTKTETDDKIGDIDSALDEIIALQVEKGGDAV